MEYEPFFLIPAKGEAPEMTCSLEEFYTMCLSLPSSQLTGVVSLDSSQRYLKLLALQENGNLTLEAISEAMDGADNTFISTTKNILCFVNSIIKDDSVSSKLRTKEKNLPLLLLEEHPSEASRIQHGVKTKPFTLSYLKHKFGTNADGLRQYSCNANLCKYLLRSKWPNTTSDTTSIVPTVLSRSMLTANNTAMTSMALSVEQLSSNDAARLAMAAAQHATAVADNSGGQPAGFVDSSIENLFVDSSIRTHTHTHTGDTHIDNSTSNETHIDNSTSNATHHHYHYSSAPPPAPGVPPSQPAPSTSAAATLTAEVVQQMMDRQTEAMTANVIQTVQSSAANTEHIVLDATQNQVKQVVQSLTTQKKPRSSSFSNCSSSSPHIATILADRFEMESPDRESTMQQQQIRRYRIHPSAFLQDVFDRREGVAKRFQAIQNEVPMHCRNEILDSDTFQFPRAIVFSEQDVVDHGSQLLSENLLLGPAAEHPIGTAVVTTDLCRAAIIFHADERYNDDDFDFEQVDATANPGMPALGLAKQYFVTITLGEKDVEIGVMFLSASAAEQMMTALLVAATGIPDATMIQINGPSTEFAEGLSCCRLALNDFMVAYPADNTTTLQFLLVDFIEAHSTPLALSYNPLILDRCSFKNNGVDFAQADVLVRHCLI